MSTALNCILVLLSPNAKINFLKHTIIDELYKVTRDVFSIELHKLART